MGSKEKKRVVLQIIKQIMDVLYFIELSIGKIILVQKRAIQDNVDVALMLHPA